MLKDQRIITWKTKQRISHKKTHISQKKKRRNKRKLNRRSQSKKKR